MTICVVYRQNIRKPIAFCATLDIAKAAIDNIHLADLTQAGIEKIKPFIWLDIDQTDVELPVPTLGAYVRETDDSPRFYIETVDFIDN
jgi:hypothetical protein